MAKIVDWDRHIGRHLKLRDLHVFFRVVQLGSMAKAAAHLRVTQPAVSQVIADLEHALGVKLLDRNPRGIEPTVYGQALLKGGAAAFDDLKQTIKEIEFLSEAATGEVRVGCPETVAAILPPVIENLYRRYPRIVLHVSEVVAPTLDLPQIRNRSLDVAIVRIVESPSRHPFGDDLDVEVLFNDENVVVANTRSRWARRRKIDLAELVDEHWIVPPAGTTSGLVVMEAFRARGLSPPMVSPVTFSVALRTNLLASGQHLTVFPRSMMNLHAARMSLKILPVKLPALAWPTVVVTLKNRMPNPAVKLFVDEVRNEFKNSAFKRAFLRGAARSHLHSASACIHRPRYALKVLLLPMSSAVLHICRAREHGGLYDELSSNLVQAAIGCAPIRQDVRFAPESRHRFAYGECRLRAKSGLRDKKQSDREPSFLPRGTTLHATVQRPQLIASHRVGQGRFPCCLSFSFIGSMTSLTPH